MNLNTCYFCGSKHELGLIIKNENIPDVLKVNDDIAPSQLKFCSPCFNKYVEQDYNALRLELSRKKKREAFNKKFYNQLNTSNANPLLNVKKPGVKQKPLNERINNSVKKLLREREVSKDNEPLQGALIYWLGFIKGKYESNALSENEFKQLSKLLDYFNQVFL